MIMIKDVEKKFIGTCGVIVTYMSLKNYPSLQKYLVYLLKNNYH